ncbi:hypothetical protein DSECCO2_645650 [anaerobic digester metagenome]
MPQIKDQGVPQGIRSQVKGSIIRQQFIQLFVDAIGGVKVAPHLFAQGLSVLIVQDQGLLFFQLFHHILPGLHCLAAKDRITRQGGKTKASPVIPRNMPVSEQRDHLRSTPHIPSVDSERRIGLPVHRRNTISEAHAGKHSDCGDQRAVNQRFSRRSWQQQSPRSNLRR